MPRLPSPSYPRVRRPLQAELVIQYKGSRAVSIVSASREDRLYQEETELRKTASDLKELELVAHGFYPSRYDVQWKHGSVGVGWRLSKGSVEHRNLQYLVRAAHENLQSAMERCEIAHIRWLEDLRLLPIRTLPTEPPENFGYTRPAEHVYNSESYKSTEVTILPPLTICHTGTRVILSGKLSSSDSSPTTPVGPQASSLNVHGPVRSIAAERCHSGQRLINQEFPENIVLDYGEPPSVGKYEGRRSSLETLERCEDKTAPDASRTHHEQESTQQTTDQHRAHDTSAEQRNDKPNHAIIDASDAPPDGALASESSQSSRRYEEVSPRFEELQKNLIVERKRREQLERDLSVEKQRSGELITSSAAKLLALDTALSRAQTEWMSLETKHAELQVENTRLKTSLASAQSALAREHDERLRLIALLESVARESQSPLVVPALIDAFGLIDQLTILATKKT